LSWDRYPFKRVGLHYIDFSESVVAGYAGCLVPEPKIAQIDGTVTNFG
jgi:hypothetical protein